MRGDRRERGRGRTEKDASQAGCEGCGERENAREVEVGKEDGEQLSRQRAYDGTEADTHIALMDACSRCHTDEPMMQQATVHTHLRMIVRVLTLAHRHARTH